METVITNKREISLYLSGVCFKIELLSEITFLASEWNDIAFHVCCGRTT